MKVFTRRAGTITGPVNGFERLTFAEQVNTPTGGSILLPADSPALTHLLSASTTTDIIGLAVVDDVTGRIVPLFVAEEKFTGHGGSVTVPLMVDTALINEVPAFPNPANPAAPWASASHWTATDSAVAVTASFLDSHGGPGSHVDYRRFDVITTDGFGPNVTFRARMKPSLDEVRETVAGEAIVDATLTDDRRMGLHVRAPVDRPNVVFSAELHTMTDWSYENRMPPANVFYAGGAGEGIAREIAVAELTSNLWPRKRGVFLDRSASGADLQAEADKEAVWDGPTLRIDATDRDLVYGRHWLLGDTVRADIGSNRFTLPVNTVATTVTTQGVERTVTLGTPRLAGRPDLDLKRALFSRFGLTEHT